MPKDRDRALNPATAHLKSQKAAALKKSKAALSAQRSERLSKRNPDRLQRQIEELKTLQEAQGGTLRPREKQELEKLERDVKAIQKARGSEGTAAGEGERRRNEDAERAGGRRRGDGRGGSMLGKRRRDDHRGSHYHHDDDASESEATDPEVRDIPMPRDTPPPIPPRRFRDSHRSAGTGANSIAVPARPRISPSPAPVVAPAKTTYESAPQIRNLRKEATAKFVPGAVAARLKASKSGNVGGRYLEPEEVDELEEAGYLGVKRTDADAGVGELQNGDEVKVDIVPPRRTLEEEEAAFERELMETEERESLAWEGMEDAEMAAEEAVKEAEYEMMADELEEAQNGGIDAGQAERRLRYVEMEEVEDEDA